MIEAKQLKTHADVARISVWLDAHHVGHMIDLQTGGIVIDTLEGQMAADLGDWIIKGVHGEFYPCRAAGEAPR